MRELEVVGVRVEMPSNSPVVLLRETGGGKYLPIWVGAPEAAAIAYAQQGIVPPRPLTHDLLRDVIEALGARVVEVRITALRDGVYYAVLVFASGVEVSARPSDAIALAIRVGARISGAAEVLDEAGIELPEESDPADADVDAAAADDQVAQFREFLDHISPEDFG